MGEFALPVGEVLLSTGGCNMPVRPRFRSSVETRPATILQSSPTTSSRSVSSVTQLPDVPKRFWTTEWAPALEMVRTISPEAIELVQATVAIRGDGIGRLKVGLG